MAGMHNLARHFLYTRMLTLNAEKRSLRCKGIEGHACAVPASCPETARPLDAEEETEERLPCHLS
jgi:hypothetical protein